MSEELLPSFTWLNPTRVIYGVGVLSSLPSIVGEVAGRDARVFLVTGRRSLREHGVLQGIVDSLGVARVTLFDRVTPYPSPELVDSALEACRGAAPNVVVAVGGGSAMDLAKLVAILLVHEGTSLDYATGEKPFRRSGLPFVAVPTTSGSSSEVTPNAALWDMDAKRLMAVISPHMYPTVAVVDPELCMTMPKSLAAATGMDAFTSALEAYWSTAAQPISDAIGLEVIRLFAANLERSCIEGDLESRGLCAMAATMSGIAYTNSLPNACHGIGGPLTLFWGVSHGQAVGVTLPTFLRWNAPAITHKLPALWDALGVAGLEQATELVTRMMARIGLETRLGPLGLDRDDVETVLDHTRWDRLATLPHPAERADVRRLLQELI